MRYGIAGRVAVITGAAGGIGVALARAFAREGVRLILVDRDGARLDQFARHAEIAAADTLCLASDLGRDADVAALAGRISAHAGRVDILVNNAGAEFATPLADEAPDFMARWEELLRKNVGSMVRLTRSLLPLLPAGAVVINQSSIWGHVAVADFSAYVASKHAVLGLTRSLAWELAPRSIRVNAVCPGWVRTAAALRSLGGMAQAAGQPAEALLDEILAGQAVPALLEADDLAGAFLFLASDDARAITGQSLVVSHGEVMR